MLQAKTNEELVRRFFEEVWNRKNDSVIDELIAEDSLCYGLPDPDAVVRGREAFREIVRSFCGAFPDLHITLEDVISAGDRVAARWVATGTHLGDQLGFPASGKAVTLAGATIGIVRDSQIREGWNLMDMGHLFESLRPESSRSQ